MNDKKEKDHKYYSLCDNQGKIPHSGRNSETKKEALQDIFLMWLDGSGAQVALVGDDFETKEEFKEKLEEKKKEILNDFEELKDLVYNICGYKLIGHDEKIKKDHVVDIEITHIE